MEKIYQTEGKCQIIIITGYLGSGKTTFINELLSKNKLKGKTAVLENEFGSVGIDGKIINKKGIELREVSGGCVCCTEQGRLVQELTVLSEMGMDNIIIEATGVADPNSIAAELFEPALFGKVRRGTGICIVDSINYNDYKNDDIAITQLSFADVFYLSKTDNNDSEDTLDTITESLSIVNSDASISKEINGNFIELLNSNHERKTFLKNQKSGANHGFSTFTFTSEASFDIELFRYTINRLLKTDKFYRIKGVVKCNDNQSLFFESVRYYGEEKPLTVLGYDSHYQPESSQLVFIGKDVDKITVIEELYEAIV
jgi:G3E family GTPase